MKFENMSLEELYILRDEVRITIEKREREAKKNEAWKNLVQQMKSFMQDYGHIEICDELFDESIFINSLCNFNCNGKILVE